MGYDGLDDITWVAAGVSGGLIDLISDMYVLLTLPGSGWCESWVDRFDQ